MTSHPWKGKTAMATEAVPQAGQKQHWAVSVAVDGENILTIESNCLSGIENIDDYAGTVRMCAEHLLSFIGDRRPAPVEAVDAEPVAWESINTLGANNVFRSKVAALQWAEDEPSAIIPLYSAATLATLHAENEKLKESEARMLLHIGDLARRMGEAEGKLAASELPGIVDGWKERAEAAESLVSDLRKEVERKDAALEPLARYYDINDLDEAEDTWAIEVPVGDLRCARDAFTNAPKEKTDD